MSAPRLRVIVGHRVQREVDLDGPVTVGRRPDNDVVLKDDAVSGHHGRIEPADEGWRYVDLGSMNGSLVAAGPRLGRGEAIELDDLTQILIGHTVLEFRPAGEAEPLGIGSGSGAASASGGSYASTPTAASVGAATPPPLEALTPPPLEAAALDDDGRRTTDLRRGRREPAVRHEGAQPGLILTPAVEPPSELAHDTGGMPSTDVDAARRPAPATPVAEHGEARGPARPARLLVVLGGGVEVHDLTDARVVLGRSAECGVEVPHPSVSDEHLELRHRDGRWQATDLGSTNGSRVDLAPLQGSRSLADLNHIIVGAVDVLFLDHARPAQGDLDAARFIEWLRRRRRIGRGQAKACLALVEAEGLRVEDALVRERVLAPGAVTELRHNAERGIDEPPTRGPLSLPAWAWISLGVLALALILSLVL